jgi:uncharacterized protein (DUF433 family)
LERHGEDTAVQTQSRSDALIAAYIEPNPQRPGADEARLKEFGVSVWAIIDKYQTANGDLAHVARQYDVPIEAIEAAVAYYSKHRAVINNRRAANYPEYADT